MQDSDVPGAFVAQCILNPLMPRAAKSKVGKIFEGEM